MAPGPGTPIVLLCQTERCLGAPAFREKVIFAVDAATVQTSVRHQETAAHLPRAQGPVVRPARGRQGSRCEGLSLFSDRRERVDLRRASDGRRRRKRLRRGRAPILGVTVCSQLARHRNHLCRIMRPSHWMRVGRRRCRDGEEGSCERNNRERRHDQPPFDPIWGRMNHCQMFMCLPAGYKVKICWKAVKNVGDPLSHIWSEVIAGTYVQLTSAGFVVDVPARAERIRRDNQDLRRFFS